MAGQGSARVTLKEIDLSQVSDPEVLPQGVPAAVVGPAKRGPAFVPKTFATMQQFSETFGSMQEVSKDSNANKFAPLALNEWMRNAQAGTFLRVLGIGSADGTLDSSKKTQGAGFVVGENITHDADNQLTHNTQYANLEASHEEAAREVARTHFLGCFMKDANDSTFLKDAGIQLENASGQATLTFTEVPANDDNLLITGVSSTGTRVFRIKFDNSVNTNTIANDVNPATPEATLITVGTNGYDANRVALNLFRALNSQNKDGDPLADPGDDDPTEYFSSSNPVQGQVIIRQQGAGESSNTQITFDINSGFSIEAGSVSKQNSLATQTVSSTDSGATFENTVITCNNKPQVAQHAKSTITIENAAAPNADESFVVHDGGGNSQQFVIKTNQANITQAGANDPIFVGIQGVANEAALATIIYTAINSALNDTNVTSAILAANLTVTDPSGAVSFELETVANVAVNIIQNSNVSDVTVSQTQDGNDTDSSITVQDKLGNSSEFIFKAADNNVSRNAANVYFIGIKDQVEKVFEVADASNIIAQFEAALDLAIDNADDAAPITKLSTETQANEITITSELSGLINGIASQSAADFTIVPTLGVEKTVNSAISLTLSGDVPVGNEFDLNTVVHTTGLKFTNTVFEFVANDNGNSNGILSGGKYQIEIPEGEGNVIDIQLSNIRHAIETALGDEYTSEIDFDLNKITITTVRNESFVQDQQFVFKLSDVVKVEGLTTVSGRFGPQVISFAGGGGGCAPVVRGLLMTPQGVRASLDISNASYSSASQTDVLKSVTDAGVLRSFGNTPADNLLGYDLGKVDNNSFKVILNGFKNSEQPSILTCSFDPENVNYFAKVLNTDPTKLEERGHYLYSHWDIDPSVSTVSSEGLLNADGTIATLATSAFCLPAKGLRNREDVNQPNFEAFDTRFRTASSPWIVSQSSHGNMNLFKLHALDDGKFGNDRFRVKVSNIKAGQTSSAWGSFDLSLELFDSDPIGGEAVVSWRSLSLDPDSRNFIARVIGNKNVYYDFKKSKLVETGEFEIRNKYVRVEINPALMSGDENSLLPCGFKGYRTLNTDLSSLFDESGTDGQGTGRLLAQSSLENVKVLPLPFVKTITRASGTQKSASSDLAWGVKFAKKKVLANSSYKHSEIGEIRFNPSIKSWTQFYPDMGTYSFSKESSELFSLERIAVDNKSNIDWSTSEYIRSGNLSDLPATDDTSDGAEVKKSFVDLKEAASVGTNVKYLQFRCLMQGGFDGVNIFDSEKYNLTSIAAFREANDELDNDTFTGPTVVSYKKAIDVLADKSAVEFQLLAIPGIREPLVTDYALLACENRFDAMFVMDVEEVSRDNQVILDKDIQPHVGNIITRFANRTLNTSFGAAYYPDVITRRTSNRSPIQVPPSVCMLGVISQNDTLADPWFAPAGLTRGRLNALNSKVQMNRETLNDLYDVDINPIYEPSGRSGEVYAFGQKTLLENESALDRINVRRLLINLRRRVKSIANTFLFEPNRASTLSKFSALVEPIMAEVQARQGVERYKVQIDTSTTTQNDVENNTIRGKIYLQPTKSVEFISLDFVVTNSID